MPPTFLIANPENRRTTFLQEGLARLGHPPATVLAYQDLLAGTVNLAELLPQHAILRIDSPGENYEVEKALLVHGAEAAAQEGCPVLPAEVARDFPFDRGLILHPRQWYLGFRRLLRDWQQQLARRPDVRVMNAPADIERMYEKSRCHADCEAAGVSVPRSLPNIRCYDELCEQMRAHDMNRVFLKLSTGSSATGVVAFQRHPTWQLAITSAEMVRTADGLRLYNSLRISHYREQRDIADLVDTLCREQVHVEQWIPKAVLAGEEFDLRIVVIGGRARHFVVRQSRHPMTNLHLGNRRGDGAQMLELLGPERWQAVQQTCEATMQLFPASHYAGVDICLARGLRRHYVLEVNAFGDLLPRIEDDGLDTYTAEIQSFLTAS